MKTPKSTTETFYDFSEMVKMVDEELGYDQRDCGKHFFPDTGDITAWHKAKGYPKKDSEGNAIHVSQLFFAEFRAECAIGKWNATPYLDFWHWQIDNCMAEDFRNDAYSKFSVGLKQHAGSDITSWQLEILKVWNKLFSHIADDYGNINIKVGW